MNRKTLQKVIDELNKPQPKLDYIRGVLETVIETLPEEKYINDKSFYGKSVADETRPLNQAENKKDETEILEGIAKARIANVKNLANQSISNV
jgi:SOS response regulatory protein OraA/RecX